MKQCSICKQWKDELEFNKRKDTKDGLRTECRICQIEYNKKYYKTSEGKQKHQNYMESHKEFYKEYERKYATRRSELYRLNKQMTLAICHSLRKPECFNTIQGYLNYTLQDLCQHLESQFTSKMSWSNYGEYWEIDHIIPQNVFSITSPDDSDFKICWSLANLRPLEKSLNRQRPKDGSDILEELKQRILYQFKS